MSISKEEFNSEPVYYCSECLSLSIVSADSSVSFCTECGCAMVEKDSVEQWENKYRNKYGQLFLDKKRAKMFKL